MKGIMMVVEPVVKAFFLLNLCPFFPRPALSTLSLPLQLLKLNQCAHPQDPSARINQFSIPGEIIQILLHRQPAAPHSHLQQQHYTNGNGPVFFFSFFSLCSGENSWPWDMLMTQCRSDCFKKLSSQKTLQSTKDISLCATLWVGFRDCLS